jgi:hypothetical protein
MKKVIPLLLAVVLAFALVSSAFSWNYQGTGITRIFISTRGSPSAIAPRVCRLPAGVPVYLITHLDETNMYGMTVRWWFIHPATDTAPVCDGWLKSGALRDVVIFEPAKKAR